MPGVSISYSQYNARMNFHIHEIFLKFTLFYCLTVPSASVYKSLRAVMDSENRWSFGYLVKSSQKKLDLANVKVEKLDLHFFSKSVECFGLRSEG